MNKKSLLSLLVVPLLLAGCAGGKGPGEKGEDVLTAEQKEKYLASEVDNYRVEDKKVVDVKIDTTEYPYTITSGVNRPFFVRYKTTSSTEANEWKIYSALGGEIATITRPADAITVSSLYVSAGSTEGLFNNTIKYITYNATFEKDDEVISYNARVDMFGNVLWKSNKPVNEEYIAHMNIFNETDPDTGDKTYAVEITAYNSVTGQSRVTTVGYDENFKSLSPYTRRNPNTPAEVHAFYHKDIEYRVGSSGGSGFEYYVAHTDKEGNKVIEYFDYPDGADVEAFIGESLVYQRRVSVNIHEENYTYTQGENAYRLVTERLNLVDFKKEEIEFPYYIDEFDDSIFLDEEATVNDPIVIPQYSVAKLKKVVNKHLNSFNEKFVVDEELVLHDDLNALSTGLKKFGESHYYDDQNSRILDKDYNVVTMLNGYQMVDNALYAKCMLVSRNNRYGVIDETGKVLVPVAYTGYDITTFNIVAFLKGSAGNQEVLYFNPYTLESSNRVLDPERPLVEGSKIFYLQKGVLNEETSEYSDNEFYYAGKKVATYKYFAANPVYSTLTCAWNKNTHFYSYATFTTTEGEFVILSVDSLRTIVK